MKLFPSLDAVGEQRILMEARKMIGNSQSADRILEKIITGSTNLDRLHKLKSDSYETVFNFSNSITSGAIAPNLIPDMIQLIGAEYKIMDMIFILARALTRYRIDNPVAKRYVSGRLLATNDLVTKALSALYTMHAEDTMDGVKRLRDQVKLIEEQGDEIKEEMLSYAYNTKMDYKAFYHVTSLAYLSDDVLDSCEETADILMNIMLAIAT